MKRNQESISRKIRGGKKKSGRKKKVKKRELKRDNKTRKTESKQKELREDIKAYAFAVKRYGNLNLNIIIYYIPR